MSAVDRAQVKKLAELAHLSLTDEECDAFTAELEQILRYAERIQGLDTESVEPTSHALLERGAAGALGNEATRALRQDEAHPGLDRERVLEGAPDAGQGLFKVPKVLP